MIALVRSVLALSDSTTNPTPSGVSQRSIHGQVVSRNAHTASDRCGAGSAGVSASAPRHTTLFVDFITRSRLSTITYLPVPAAQAPARTADLSTVSSVPARTNIGPQKAPAMNTNHPIDDEVMDMHDTHRKAVRLLSRDGVIDQDERELLDLINGHHRRIGAYRLREIAADSWKRNGLSKLTRRRFSDAGANVVSLDDHRTDNIVPLFPTQQTAG